MSEMTPRAWAVARGVDMEGHEVVVRLADGWTLRSSSEDFLSGDYVRICTPDGEEHKYWHYDEWQADPQLVMGAIINVAAGDRTEIERIDDYPGSDEPTGDKIYDEGAADE